jgi:hypothetical protein
VLTLWSLQTLNADNFQRFPGSPHYLFPGAVFVLLVALEAARGVSWSPRALLVLFGVAAAGAGANLLMLDNQSVAFRNSATPQTRSALGALDIAGPRTDPNFAFGAPAKVDMNIRNAFLGVAAVGEPPTADYFDASRRYGALGYSPDRLRQRPGADPIPPAMADSVLVSAQRLQLAPAPRARSAGRCLTVGPAVGGAVLFPLPAGRAVLISGATGFVTMRRFAATGGTPVGLASPSARYLLRTPVDGAPGFPWYVSAGTTPVRICPPA